MPVFWWLISIFGPLIPISAFIGLILGLSILILLLKLLSMSMFLFKLKSPPPEGILNLGPLISKSGPFPSILISGDFKFGPFKLISLLIFKLVEALIPGIIPLIYVSANLFFSLLEFFKSKLAFTLGFFISILFSPSIFPPKLIFLFKLILALASGELILISGTFPFILISWDFILGPSISILAEGTFFSLFIDFVPLIIPSRTI